MLSGSHVQILRWANFNCELSKLPKTPENVRNMLGQELFGLIRFPTMSTKDFADVVGSHLISLHDFCFLT